MNFEPFRAGQTLSASALTALVEEVERLSKLSTSGKLQHSDNASGISLWLTLPRYFWIKLTGGGAFGLYVWNRVDATSPGIWTTSLGNESGTLLSNPATEINANATVNLSPNPVVRAWVDQVSGAVMFQAGSC